MIVIIPYNEQDWQRAERLCDAIYWISGCKPMGHCLLVADNAVHPEYRLKVRLAAGVAFASVDSTEVGVRHDASKIVSINTAFRHAGHYAFNTFKSSWLWLEADNVPVKSTWLKDLFKAYDKQPKRFMGRFMRAKSGDFMSRTGIYPANAIQDLDNSCKGEPPFERVANILSKCSSTPLIHMQAWSPEMSLPKEVVLVNGDRTGVFVEQLIEQSNGKPKFPKTKAIA